MTPQTARHPLSIGHLVMGIAFAGLTVVWSLVAADVVDGPDVRFLLPAPWVLAGAAGLIALVVTDRRRHGTRAEGWVGLEEQPAADADPEPDPEPAESEATEPEPTEPTEPADDDTRPTGTMGA